MMLVRKFNCGACGGPVFLTGDDIVCACGSTKFTGTEDDISHFCGGEGIKCKECGAPADCLVADGVVGYHYKNDRYLCNDCLKNKGGAEWPHYATPA